MRVIATAGHVDHGKSKLVEAITGTHPDRLQEERDREMTIVLGFAWFTTPGGEDVGIVDVPGHRDFIENMLSGVGSIDGVIFVVAADEGVMPQTREHLAILDLLGVPGGVIVLTKTDLVQEPDWLELVEAEVSETVQGTVLQDAEIIQVSARQGIGVDTVIAAVDRFLSNQQIREDVGRARLSVDRSFTVQGFGSVVTGTLLDGKLKIGDEVEILPGGIRGRIRGLQTHKQKVEEALPGSRTAINISGVSLDAISRGDVVAHPGFYKPSRRLDVKIRLLPDISSPLKHNAEIKFFVGASEIVGRARVLGVEQLLPGESGYLQIELKDPVVVNRLDRFILRIPSPGETIGGGEIINPHPLKRYRRFDENLFEMLENIHQGSLDERIYHTVHNRKQILLSEIADSAREEMNEIGAVIDELAKNGKLVVISRKPNGLSPDDLVLDRDYFESLISKTRELVDGFHLNSPLRTGMLREEVRTKTGMEPRVFDRVVDSLVESGEYTEAGLFLQRSDHKVEYSLTEKEKIQALMANFERTEFQPPSTKECIERTGEDVYFSLVEQGRLVQVSTDVVFRKEEYDRLVTGVKKIVQETGGVSVGQLRDAFDTSRKYILAFLEYLDAQGVTKRVGDTRKLKTVPK